MQSTFTVSRAFSLCIRIWMWPTDGDIKRSCQQQSFIHFYAILHAHPLLQPVWLCQRLSALRLLVIWKLLRKWNGFFTTELYWHILLSHHVSLVLRFFTVWTLHGAKRFSLLLVLFFSKANSIFLDSVDYKAIANEMKPSHNASRWIDSWTKEEKPLQELL